MKVELRAGYTEAFKRHVVGEIELGRISQSEAREKYGILGHSTILKWCRKYGRLFPHRDTKIGIKSMDEKEKELLLLQNENKALRKELEEVRFKNVVLETLVDIAERELQIPIRKKYGAKQSVK
jgi:transposase-like protein